MSGHGKRETILRANAIRWRDRVGADMATATGCAALSEHRLSIQFVNDVVDAIASHIAAGDDLVVNHHSSRRRLVAKFLAAHGYVEIVRGCDRGRIRSSSRINDRCRFPACCAGRESRHHLSPNRLRGRS